MTTDAVTENTTKSTDKLKAPKRYKVIFLNDNLTPVEFVVALLMSIFKHSQPAAMELTLKIHNEGSAVVGIYNYEIAEQKSMEATNMSRNNGYPLVIKVEAE